MDMMLSIFGALVLWSALPFIITVVILIVLFLVYWAARSFDAVDRLRFRLRKRFSSKGKK